MPPSASLSPLLWRQLLALIAERRVIPIIGPDVVVVETERGAMPYVRYLAERVEAILELKTESSAATPTLHDVACRYLAHAGGQQISDVHAAVKIAIDEWTPPMPDSLRKLAAIAPFRLFVTTTFDTLLERALDDGRHDGTRRTASLAYSPARPRDIPASLRELAVPVVYHLLGVASSVPDYAVTDEDTLEFMHSLQSENRRPNLLLDAMQEQSLLVIGSHFPDWLSRFFLRLAKNERLLLARAKTDVVVDQHATLEPGLRDFLRSFSGQTRVVDAEPLTFIDELSTRWQEFAATLPVPEPEPVAVSAAPSRVPMPTFAAADHAIFISYASEDREVALRFANALTEAHLPVWLDRAGGLEGGDDYEQKIRDKISSASLFIPLLSRNVLTPQRRFFRLEWVTAGELSKRASPELPFIVPVRTGNVPPDSAAIPDFIRRSHWLDIDGDGLAIAVDRVRALFRQHQVSLAGV